MINIIPLAVLLGIGIGTFVIKSLNVDHKIETLDNMIYEIKILQEHLLEEVKEIKKLKKGVPKKE